MSDSPKSNTIWWIAGGVVVAYLLYNHGTTGTVSTVTTGRGSNIGLPQTKRSVGGFTTRPTVGAAQTNLRNTTATGAISTTTTSQASILNGILAGINKLASKGGGMSLGGGGGGKPHLATAGGKDFEKLPKVILEFKNIVDKY